MWTLHFRDLNYFGDYEKLKKRRDSNLGHLDVVHARYL